MPSRTHAINHIETLWRHGEVGLAIVDTQTMRILQANPFFARALDYTTTELEGKHVDEITDHADRGIGIAEIERVKTGDVEFYRQTKTYRGKTGKRVSATTQSFPIRDDDDQIEHFLSLIVLRLSGIDNGRIEVLESEYNALKQVVLSLVGRDQNTTVISNSTGATGRGDVSMGNQSNTPKTAIVWALVVAAVLMALGAFALNGSFTATDGERTIEVESQSDER